MVETAPTHPVHPAPEIETHSRAELLAKPKIEDPQTPEEATEQFFQQVAGFQNVTGGGFLNYEYGPTVMLFVRDIFSGNINDDGMIIWTPIDSLVQNYQKFSGESIDISTRRIEVKERSFNELVAYYSIDHEENKPIDISFDDILDGNLPEGMSEEDAMIETWKRMSYMGKLRTSPRFFKFE